MTELRYRTSRLRVYAGLCPADAMGQRHAEIAELLDRLDEDGMEALFKELVLEPERLAAAAILREARQLGERLNVMDRMLPSLPHAEIGGCYSRLREIAERLDALGLSGG
jgi:hypothetical protein